MINIVKIRTPYDRAEKAGKEILRKATEEHHKRKEYGAKESYQAAKEGATYLYNLRRGKVTVVLNFIGDKSMNYKRVFGHN